MKSKISVLILAAILLIYGIAIFYFKYSDAQGWLKQAIMGGTIMYLFTFRSDLSICILLILAFFCLLFMVRLIQSRRFILSSVLIVPGLFCLLLPIHFVATNVFGESMKEYLGFIEIKKVEIDDNWGSAMIAGGYDRSFHHNTEYRCFRYCDSFFRRNYQVGKTENFSVFNGIGPLFNLEDEKMYKN